MAPGRGARVFDATQGRKVLVAQVLGQVFMKRPFDDPFSAVETVLKTHRLGGAVQAAALSRHLSVLGSELERRALEFNKIDPFHPFRLAVEEGEAMKEVFTGGSAQRELIESRAVVLQSHWLGGHLDQILDDDETDDVIEVVGVDRQAQFEAGSGFAIGTILGFEQPLRRLDRARPMAALEQ